MPNNAGQPDTDNVDIGRRADHYRKHGTAVASSVSVLFRDNTFDCPSGSVAHDDDENNASIGMIVRQVG